MNQSPTGIKKERLRPLKISELKKEAVRLELELRAAKEKISELEDRLDTTFYSYDLRHQECHQHNIRYAKGSIENDFQSFSMKIFVIKKD